MWISNRRHDYRVCGIRLHPIGVFSNVLMQNKRHENRKTSDWSKSYCSVHGRYRQRYLRVRDRVFNNFVINVDIEPWSRLRWRHHITSEWLVFECVHPSGLFSNVLMQKNRRGIRKTSDLSKSDCSLHDICRQRYFVYYESYRAEIVQGRVRSETASFDKIWKGYCKKNWSYCRSYNLKQVACGNYSLFP